jgi:hypothetical protein
VLECGGHGKDWLEEWFLESLLAACSALL